MAEFNNAGVPYYANRKHPPIRPREIKLPSAERLEGKANRMKAYTYVKQYLDENWKDGDRFYITTEKRKVWDSFNQRHFEEKCSHSGHSGVFFKRELIGSSWFVIVKWDDDYKPKGLGSTKCGMFDFFYYAFHEENEGADTGETINTDSPSGG